jgi:hypothetical protein
MPFAPDFAGDFKLLDETIAWRFALFYALGTHIFRCLTVTEQFRVGHFAQTSAKIVRVEAENLNASLLVL